MILKDQASKLREMMNIEEEKEQQGTCIPVAVLSCGNDMGKEFAKQLSMKISSYDRKNVLFVNTEVEQEDIKTLIERPRLFNQVEGEFLSPYNEIKESFSSLYELMMNQKNKQDYVNTIRKIENYKEVLLYYCGTSINAKAMNLMALSSVIILIIDGTRDSIEMAANVLKVQSKIQKHAEYLLIGNELDENDIDMITKYLQKDAFLIIENHIKGIGSLSLEKLIQGDFQEIKRLKAMGIPIDGKNKTLSERLEKME